MARPQQPMKIFPPEDALELTDCHPAIDLLVFGGLLIAAERVLPLRIVQRRQCADDRLPLGDRQTRMGEPGDAADDDNAEYQCAADEQPRGDSTGRVSRSVPATPSARDDSAGD
jgi:hypothetical protein